MMQARRYAKKYEKYEKRYAEKVVSMVSRDSGYMDADRHSEVDESELRELDAAIQRHPTAFMGEVISLPIRHVEVIKPYPYDWNEDE